MTTAAARPVSEIHADIARYTTWQAVSTVKAGGSFAAWVNRRLTETRAELADAQRGGIR